MSSQKHYRFNWLANDPNPDALSDEADVLGLDYFSIQRITNLSLRC